MAEIEIVENADGSITVTAGNWKIDISKDFSQSEKDEIVNTLTHLQLNTVQGLILFGEADPTDNGIYIFPTSGSSNYIPNVIDPEGVTRKGIELNLSKDSEELFFLSDGTIGDLGAQRIIIHELVHAIKGLEDITEQQAIDALSLSSPDFRGETVDYTNSIMFEFGQTVFRNHYVSVFEDLLIFNDNGDELGAGISLTDGNIVEHTYFDLQAGSNTQIAGSVEADLVIALDGDDTILMSDGSDFIYGGPGNDLIDYRDAVSKVTITIDSTGMLSSTGGFAGTDFFDSIEGVVGSSYNDVFEISSLDTNTGQKYIRFEGGKGFDTIDFSSATSGITLNHQDEQGGFKNIERYILTDNADSVDLILSAPADGEEFEDDVLFDGNAGEDTFNLMIEDTSVSYLIFGEGEDDTISVSGGTVDIYGGLGDDVISFDGESGFTTYVFGGEGNDTITGANARLYGGAGGDTITSTGGETTLFGVAIENLLDTFDADGSTSPTQYSVIDDGSVDELIGGSGTDTFRAGDGDRISNFQFGIDKLFLHVDAIGEIPSPPFNFDGYVGFGYGDTNVYAVVRESDGDVIVGFSSEPYGTTISSQASLDVDLAISLSQFTIVFVGADVDEVLSFIDGSGNISYELGAVSVDGSQQKAPSDIITSSQVDDGMANAAGDNPILGTIIGDVLSGTEGIDIIYAGGGRDVVDGLGGNDTIYGGLRGDELAGGAGDDIIFGEDGKDELRGGLGYDTLNGGSGNDTYIYTRGDGEDTIIDSSAEGDRDELKLVNILPDDISFLEVGSTIIVVIESSSAGATDGGQITLTDGIQSSGDIGIDRIVFDDGTVWVREYISALIDQRTEPIAADIDLGAIDEDTSLIISTQDLLVAVLDIDTPIEDLSLVSMSVDATIGGLVLGADGDYTFTPNANFNGNDIEITYEVSDVVNSDTGTITLDVTSVNDAPISGELSFGALDNGTSVTLTQSQLLSTSTDPDNDTLTVISAGVDGTIGTVSQNPNGDFVLVINKGLVGEGYEFEFVVSDGIAETNALATFSLDYPNDAPIVPNVDLGWVASNAPTIIRGADLLNNASDPDGDSLSIVSLFVAPEFGNIQNLGVNDFIFLPVEDIAETDVSFTFIVSDGTETTSSVASGDFINVLVGTPESEIIIDISNQGSLLDGGPGDDDLIAVDGNDIIIGGEGADILFGGLGDDTFVYYQGDGHDTIIDNLEVGLEDILNGYGSFLSDTGGADTLILHDIETENVAVQYSGVGFGGEPHQTFMLEFLDDTGAVQGSIIIPGSVPGFLFPEIPIESVIFDDGTVWGIDDIIQRFHDGPPTGGQTITGTEGDDILDGTSGDDIISGLGGSDYLRGNAGDDSLDGGFGVDFLRGGAGADTLFGGEGQDWADYSTSSLGVTVDLSAGIGSGGDAQGDTYTLVERVQGSSKDDTITGDAGVNYLRGLAGDDVIIGGAGNDYLQGDSGADILDGGAGTNDWVYYVSSTAGLTVNLGDNSLNTGEAIGDSYVNIENLVGSNHDDDLTGDNENNFLRGLIGDDTLQGGDGNDFLRGDQGADVHDGGTGNDWAYYVTSNAAVTINLLTNTASGGHAAGDTFISIERVYGSRFNDNITGDTGVNYLRGYFGDDFLTGGDGNDFLQGDAGGDTLDGGLGSDWAYYFSSTSTSGITINLADSSQNTGEAIGDSYISIENIVGSRYDDIITGDDADNYLRGAQGDDTINGGLGNDLLRGESGADTFVFTDAAFGADTITDFTNGSDMLDFSVLGFGLSDFTVTQVGNDTLLTLISDTDQTLLLQNFTATDIDAADFASDQL